MSTESPGQVAMRLRMEANCRKIADRIVSFIPKSQGFALFLYDFGVDGSLSYVSNGVRADVVRMMEEWLARTQGHDLAAENQKLRSRIEALEAAANGLECEADAIVVAHEAELRAEREGALAWLREKASQRQRAGMWSDEETLRGCIAGLEAREHREKP